MKMIIKINNLIIFVQIYFNNFIWIKYKINQQDNKLQNIKYKHNMSKMEWKKYYNFIKINKEQIYKII